MIAQMNRVNSPQNVLDDGEKEAKAIPRRANERSGRSRVKRDDAPRRASGVQANRIFPINHTLRARLDPAGALTTVRSSRENHVAEERGRREP